MTRPPLSAYHLFFPSAALLAVTLVPLKVLQVSGLGFAMPPTWAANWHGHEMVFGYAYAVVGGYLITKPGPREFMPAFMAWLAGRLVVLVLALPPFVEAAVALAYPVVLFIVAGLPFVRAVKRARNMIFAPLIAALTLAELLYQLGVLGVFPDGGNRGLTLGVNLILLLMFTMGGRIIAAASSGAHQAQGFKPYGVAQPGLERLGIGALVAMAVLDVLGLFPPLSHVLAVGGAIVIIGRLVRWQVWRLARVSEVALLHLGYVWLAIGLVIKSTAPYTDLIGPIDALHPAMIGGLGTLSLAMMMRVILQRLRKPIVLPLTIQFAISLISVAAVARLVAVWPDFRLASLWLAVVAWMAAFGLFLTEVGTIAVLRLPREQSAAR